MSTSRPNLDEVYHAVELNFKGVFLRDPFSYNHGKPLLFGITTIRNDGGHASYIFYAFGILDFISRYVDHDSQGIEDWFGSEIEEEDDDDVDSCFDGGENEDEIDNLTDVEYPVLSMRFKDPTQLTSMLCNYVVANGLWASWMSDEASFQIKSLKLDHKCERNYKLGSMVTYAWIGSHYTREFLLRQKMNLVDGTLFEHYAKLWSYAEEIRISNLCSTVKLDVNCMTDEKNYFSYGHSVISDQHKGLIEAVKELLSYVEHRQCVKHISQN
ncbi:unnamed protein product [Lactuca saligna]|uniref:Uncharacterized protein n=1 Tax=Lactuca saligna TaxID=75948 RepID=A0AA35ZBQ5_LACSI|nr:unnamed protein product [Lactuca saligna]